MNPIEEIAKREFGNDNAIIVDVRKRKIAGTFKVRDIKEHFDKLR